MAIAENYDNADKVRTLGHQVSYDHRSYERNKSNCVQKLSLKKSELQTGNKLIHRTPRGDVTDAVSNRKNVQLWLSGQN